MSERGSAAAGGGAVVFLTGLSGAGKSTIATAVAERIRSDGQAVTIIDGDELRMLASADLGFDRASRDANVERAATLALDAARAGQVVITALIAPFDRARRRARELVRAARIPFLLVFVHAPLDVAEARDVKGLYRRARAGEIPDFTGVTSPYEEPTDADLVIDTTSATVAEAAAAIQHALTDSRRPTRRGPGR